MKVPHHAPALLTMTVITVMTLAGCGSSSAPPAAAVPGAGGAASAQPVGDDTDSGGKDVDPCQWYTAQEMGAVLGFEVTMAATDTPLGYGTECQYNSDAEFTMVTVLPMSASEYDVLKAGTASMKGKTPTAVTGVGDEAYDDSTPDRTNGSVSLNAKKGSEAIQVSLATANDKFSGRDAGGKIVVPVAVKALGG